MKNHVFQKNFNFFKTERRIHEFCVLDPKNVKIGPLGPVCHLKVATSSKGTIQEFCETLHIPELKIQKLSNIKG